MTRYQGEVLVDIEINGDDDEEAYEQIAAIMEQHHKQTGETLGWSFTMLEGCMTNLTEQEDAIAPSATCRHCGRRIVNNPTDGWVCPDAGYDVENGDGMWRTTCEDNHQDRVAAHEPTTSAVRKES